MAVFIAVAGVTQGVDAALNVYEKWRRRGLSKIAELNSQKVSAERVMLQADYRGTNVLMEYRSGFDLNFSIRINDATELRALVEVLSQLDKPKKPDFVQLPSVESVDQVSTVEMENDENP